jgi:NADH dehydrogenase (ubiquinone) Fe-S protein 5
MDPQIARAKEIKTHFVQTQAREGADARKAAEKAATGVIVNLGLVEESS